MKIDALSNGFILINNFKIVDLRSVCAIEPQIDEISGKNYYPVIFSFQSSPNTLRYICTSEDEQNTLMRLLWELLQKLDKGSL